MTILNKEMLFSFGKTLSDKQKKETLECMCNMEDGDIFEILFFITSLFNKYQKGVLNYSKCKNSMGSAFENLPGFKSLGQFYTYLSDRIDTSIGFNKWQYLVSMGTFIDWFLERLEGKFTDLK